MITALTVPAGETSYVARSIRMFWSNLPTLLASGTATCIASAVVVYVAPGPTPLALIFWAVVVGPVFAAMVGQVSDMLLDDDAPRVFSLATYVHEFGRLGLALALPPACTGASGLVGLEWWRVSESPIALISATTCGSVTVLLVLAAVVAMPFAIECPKLRGLPLLTLSLHVVARRPVPILGVFALVAGAVQASMHLTASLVLLLPGPLAVTVVAAAWTSAEGLGMSPNKRSD